jgi:hypothetical protein
MKIRALLFAATLAAGVAGSAASASADVRVFYPPNPYAPPEAQLLVDQTAPPEVTVIFDVNPGPPDITVEPTPSR